MLAVLGARNIRVMSDLEPVVVLDSLAYYRESRRSGDEVPDQSSSCTSPVMGTKRTPMSRRRCTPSSSRVIRISS